MTQPPLSVRSGLVWPHACIGAACVSCSLGMGSGPPRAHRLHGSPADRSWGSSRDSTGDLSNLGYASNAAIAPFLTNVENHLGRVTLTAPDNIRRTNNDGRPRPSRHTSAAALRARASVQRLRATVQPDVPAARTVRPVRSMAAMPPPPTPARHLGIAALSEASSPSVSVQGAASTPAVGQSVTAHEWDRRVNVWDDIEFLQNLDRTDPPPPFSAREPENETIQPPVSASEARQVPSSPPPAFESDGERAPASTDNHHADSDSLLDEVVDPAILRERDAWERDRLLGYSLEERVQRMERRKQANESNEANLAHLRRRWQTAPCDPSSTLETVTAPASQFGGGESSQAAPTDDSSSEEERQRPNDQDSDHEWESEHNALEALYQYEADMRRTLSKDRLHAHRNPRPHPLSLQPGTLAQSPERDARDRVPGSFPSEEPTSASSTLSIVSPTSASSVRSDDALPQHNTSTRNSSTPRSLVPESATDRPLPPPPPSRVSLIRAAYDQLHQLRRDQRVFHQFDSDIAGLEEYLSRYEPLQDGSEPSDTTLSHFGGAFTNPRSSGAPQPIQAHLPAITDATRHFPPSEAGPTSTAPPLPPRNNSSEEPVPIHRSSTHEYGPGQVSTDEARPQADATNSLAAEQITTPLTPAPALPTSLRSEPIRSHVPGAEAQVAPSDEPTDTAAASGPTNTSLSEEITDLDFAVAHLDDPEMRYEWASLISDYLGPAREQTYLSLQELQHISVGRVELVSRRVTSAGRVRVRMSVAGIRVERCSVCLEQFKGGQQACILPCLHMCVYNVSPISFHDRCTIDFLRHSRLCPICRKDVTQE